MSAVRRDRDVQAGARRDDAWGTGAEHATDDTADDPLAAGTVILPARVDADVARRIAVAADRDGIAIADLLGRAAAAYDWGDDDRQASQPGGPV
jgi:hypothetical protein